MVKLIKVEMTVVAGSAEGLRPSGGEWEVGRSDFLSVAAGTELNVSLH